MNSISKLRFNSVLHRNMLVMAAIFGALAVLAGAFGAHALRELVEPNRLLTWATAVRYQMWHALALLAVAALLRDRVCTALPWIMLSWAFGIVLFSGSLYLLVLTEIPIFGAITPLGGLLLILGWLLLAFAVWRCE